MLRWAAMISPEMMFQFIASRIEEQLKKPIDRGEGIYSYFLNWGRMVIHPLSHLVNFDSL